MNKDKMKNAAKIEVPTHLTLTALLSASLTVILSAAYGVLSLLAVIYKHLCDVGRPESIIGSEYFMNVVYRLYIQQDDCPFSLHDPDLTTPRSVLILSALTLSVCVLCLIAACTLITVVSSEKYLSHVNIVANIYVCCCVASLIIDITFGIHFAMDYNTMNNRLDSFQSGMPSNYSADIIRLGAFMLMTLTLKGFLVHIINIVLLSMLVVYVVEFQKRLQRNEHSIHKVGALNAYDQKARRHVADNWQNDNNMFLGILRGPQVNPSFLSDDDPPPRTPISRREPPVSDYSRPFDRSESWQTGAVSGSRPFSYLEETKRPIPVKAPMPPTAEPQWRREESQQWRREEPQWRKEWSPPVPAPDYSPTTPRRLKSALKPM